MPTSTINSSLYHSKYRMNQKHLVDRTSYRYSLMFFMFIALLWAKCSLLHQ